MPTLSRRVVHYDGNLKSYLVPRDGHIAALNVSCVGDVHVFEKQGWTRYNGDSVRAVQSINENIAGFTPKRGK